MSDHLPEAETADRHRLYQESVQDPESELEFVETTFTELTGRRLELLREDFCGTGFTACTFVASDESHRAIGLDLDRETLDWGLANNADRLTASELDRLDLRCVDVRTVTEPVDAVLAMNFSYFLFPTRDEMRDYFSAVYQSLAPDGVFFLDAYGGYDAHRDIVEPRQCEGFQYIWEQANFNPIDQTMDCFIHYEFDDGSRIDKAFVYPWRLWTLTEIREILIEAGFSSTLVYWEGTDPETGEGDGDFVATETGTADPGWICYITATG